MSVTGQTTSPGSALSLATATLATDAAVPAEIPGHAFTAGCGLQMQLGAGD